MIVLLSSCCSPPPSYLNFLKFVQKFLWKKFNCVVLDKENSFSSYEMLLGASESSLIQEKNTKADVHTVSEASNANTEELKCSFKGIINITNSLLCLFESINVTHCYFLNIACTFSSYFWNLMTPDHILYIKFLLSNLKETLLQTGKPVQITSKLYMLVRSCLGFNSVINCQTSVSLKMNNKSFFFFFTYI